MSDGPDVFTNIRLLLGDYIGQRLIDITQHDSDEFAETHIGYVMLMFENGSTMKFFIGDEGFEYDDHEEPDV